MWHDARFVTQPMQNKPFNSYTFLIVGVAVYCSMEEVLEFSSQEIGLTLLYSPENVRVAYI